MKLSATDIKELNLLKYYRLIRKWACKTYSLSDSDLELLIYLDCKSRFTRNEFIDGTYTYSWDKDPNFKGGSGFNPSTTPGVLDRKKKQDETPTEMQFTSATPENLKIRKKKGKRGLRYKGSVGMNQSRGLSGISVGGI